MGTSAVASTASVASLSEGPASSELRSHPAIAKSAKDFILNDVPDQKRRWAKFGFAALLITYILIFTIAFAMGIRPEKDGTPDKSALHSLDQTSVSGDSAGYDATMKEIRRTLTPGAEAEAAIIQMTFPGVSDPAEHHPVKIAYLEPDIGSPLRENYLSSQTAMRTYSQATQNLENEIRNLLTTVKSACEREDKQTLLAMLDEGDPAFHAKYVSDAERLFKSFEGISVSFTGIHVNPVNEDEVLVKTHIKVEGAFALTGTWKVLKNTEQSFTLRRHDGSDWKLCAVDQ